jgi:hypothetical protein
MAVHESPGGRIEHDPQMVQRLLPVALRLLDRGPQKFVVIREIHTPHQLGKVRSGNEIGRGCHTFSSPKLIIDLERNAETRSNPHSE